MNNYNERQVKDTKVSAFVPVYNDKSTIKACLDSILNQSLNFDEIIVVNDASNDETTQILNNFKNIKIINNERNMGVSYSRNIGIKNSTNELVAGIDSDIVIEKNWLENMLEMLFKKKAVYCCGNVDEKYLENQYNYWRSLRYPLNWGRVDIKNPPFIFTNNTLQYKYIWSKTGGFDENYSQPGGDDIVYSKKVTDLYKDKIYYFSNIHSLHLANDNLYSLSNRVWRYHSFGYKIKTPSLYRFFKLIIKQVRFLITRIFQDLIKLRLSFLLINIAVFVLFIIYEIKYIYKFKK
tara:strand:- start:6222 stop:7100 length:879 start_codon:yes stop_codon:yes gene_type:complete